MKRLFLSGVGALCLWLPLSDSSPAQSEETKEWPAEFTAEKKQIRVQVEFIDLPHEQLTELMFGEKPAANDTELRQRVAQLVKDGKAKVMETLLCTGRSGQKSSTESIEEFIYPTEYEPASFAAENKKAESAKTEAAAPGKWEGIGPSPTAFETRNLGSTMEIEPNVSEDGDTINLLLVPEIVYHVKNEIWAEWKDEHGSAPVQVPVMYCLRLNTTVKVHDGKPFLVGALTPKNDKGEPDHDRKLMVFVKANVLPRVSLNGAFQ